MNTLPTLCLQPLELYEIAVWSYNFEIFLPWQTVTQKVDGVIYFPTEQFSRWTDSSPERSVYHFPDYQIIFVKRM